MKKTSSNLFELIRSLTQPEKRHFSLYASRYETSSGERNIYLKLFDALSKQKEYNEALLQKEVGIVKHFSRYKNYLHQLITKSLVIYHSETSSSIRVKNLLISIEVFHKRGLIKQCATLITKAKKIATETEQYALLIAVLDWELQINRALNSKNILQLTDEAFKKEEEASNNLKQLREYNYLRAKLNEIIKIKGSPRTLEDEQELIKELNIEKITKTPPINKESFKINYLYNIVLSSYFIISRNNSEHHKIRKNIVDLYENNPIQKTENIFEYLAALNDYAITCITANKFKEGVRTLKKLYEVNTKSRKGTAVKLEYFLPNMLDFYTRAGEPEKGIDLAKKLEPELEKVKNHFTPRHIMIINYNLMCLELVNNNFKEALKWSNKILNDDNSLKNDVYNFTKIIRLIIYFELNDMEILHYTLKNTRLFLDKRDKLYKSESTIIKHLKKASKIDFLKNRIPVFLKMKVELLILFEIDPHEKKVLDYMDFISWIDSKIENCSFVDILNEKHMTVSTD